MLCSRSYYSASVTQQYFTLKVTPLTDKVCHHSLAQQHHFFHSSRCFLLDLFPAKFHLIFEGKSIIAESCWHYDSLHKTKCIEQFYIYIIQNCF